MMWNYSGFIYLFILRGRRDRVKDPLIICVAFSLILRYCKRIHKSRRYAVEERLAKTGREASEDTGVKTLREGSFFFFLSGAGWV